MSQEKTRSEPGFRRNPLGLSEPGGERSPGDCEEKKGVRDEVESNLSRQKSYEGVLFNER